MNYKLLLFVLLALVIVSCSHKREEDIQNDYEEPVIQITAYNNEFELFAEADSFVLGKESNILSHFSNLPDFTALENGSITVRLIVNGNETDQTLDKPTRKGIYSFDLTPETVGTGKLIFDIRTEKVNSIITVPDVIIYTTEKEAHEAAEETVLSRTNTTVFTKEQSWKIDFETQLTKEEPIGQVIKTAGQIKSAQGDEKIVSANTHGIIILPRAEVLAGSMVAKGQVLFSISGSGLADNNSDVRFKEAQNNLEKTKSDYERVKELAKDKIVSEKKLLDAKNQYDNAKLIYNNLNNNFSLSGQDVVSPINGFVKRIFVQNGQYVETGEPILIISQNNTLVLTADVQQKYASILGDIISANIRSMHDNKTYTLEHLNGKIVSYGRSTNDNNFMIPVNLQIDNNGSFIPGGFVELYLKTVTNKQVLTIPLAALIEEQGSYFVFVQVTPEMFEKREVKLGVFDGSKYEVVDGISQNERIVTKGAVLIKLAQATGTLDAHSGHVH